MGPNVGTTMRVIGVQIVELVTGNGAVDSGDMSVEDVAAMFGRLTASRLLSLLSVILVLSDS